MKKLFAAFILLPLVVYSQETIPLRSANKPVSCGNLRAITNELQRVGEVPVWYGNVEEPKSILSLWISKENNTFTVLQSVDNIACVIDVGSGNVFNLKILEGK